MSNLTVTISPSGVNSIGARWCIVGVTDWLASGATTTLASAGQTLSYKYVEGYLTPANATITAEIIAATTTTATYTATQWISSWGPPMSGCLFKGQVLLGGRYYSTEQSFPSDSRIIRWSEIGAFRFLNAGANPQKNEAGFYYAGNSSSETVMRILPLEDAVVAYTTMNVILMTPVNQPAPTYGISDRFLSNIGILNPLAVDGNRLKHVYVDKEGCLREITLSNYGKGYVNKEIGYRHIFSSMQSNFDMSTGVGCLVVTYNPDENEWYISNGVDSYVYTDSGSLTEIGVGITSYINLRSSIISSELFSASSTKTVGGVTSLITDGYIYAETDILDFDVSGIKTIRQVEIDGSLGTSAVAYVMVKWRNDRSASFTDTSWVRCSPNGVASPIVSGVDVKICIKATPVSGVAINGITVEWQLHDKSSTRGNYAGSIASKPNK